MPAVAPGLPSFARPPGPFRRRADTVSRQMAMSTGSRQMWVARAPLAAALESYLSRPGALSRRALAARAGLSPKMLRKVLDGPSPWATRETAEKLLGACGRLEEMDLLDLFVAA